MCRYFLSTLERQVLHCHHICFYEILCPIFTKFDTNTLDADAEGPELRSSQICMQNFCAQIGAFKSTKVETLTRENCKPQLPPEPTVSCKYPPLTPLPDK